MSWNFEKGNPTVKMPDGTQYWIAIDTTVIASLIIGLFRQRANEPEPLLIDHPTITDFAVDEAHLEAMGVDKWLDNIKDAANLIIQADYAALPPVPATWDPNTPKPWLGDNGPLEDYLNAHLKFDTSSGIPVVKRV